MGQPSKIAKHGLGAVVETLAANGESTHGIAKRLKKEHGIKISHTAVHRWLTGKTAARGETEAVAIHKARELRRVARRASGEQPGDKWLLAVQAFLDELHRMAQGEPPHALAAAQAGAQLALIAFELTSEEQLGELESG